MNKMTTGEHECEDTYRECIEAKRRLAADAIAANPTASSRELARGLPVSRETVRNVRNSRGDKTLSSANSLGGASEPPSNPTKKQLAVEAIEKDPARRNVAIAKELGCGESTVRDARKFIADSKIIDLASTLRKPGVTEYQTEYSTEVMDWIETYRQWPRSTKKEAREAFFATINGVEINAAS